MTTQDAVSPIPPGYTARTPYLVVDCAARALDFYASVIGATVVSRNDGPDGTNQVNHSYVLYCPDVDATWRAAVAAGATPFEEPATFVTGDRFGAILDPFGHRWAIMTRVEDVSPEEAQHRVEEWLASQGG